MERRQGGAVRTSSGVPRAEPAPAPCGRGQARVLEEERGCENTPRVLGACGALEAGAARRLGLGRRPAGLLGGRGGGLGRAGGRRAPWRRLAPVAAQRLLVQNASSSDARQSRAQLGTGQRARGWPGPTRASAGRTSSCRRPRGAAGPSAVRRASLARQGSWARIVGGFGECFSIGTGRFTLLSVWPGLEVVARISFRNKNELALQENSAETREFTNLPP